MSQPLPEPPSPSPHAVDSRLPMRSLSRRQSFRFLLPVITLVMLGLAIWTTTYFLKQSEYQENESKVIADALWTRQNLQFQLESRVSTLRNSVGDASLDNGPRLRAAIEQAMRAAPEIDGVLIKSDHTERWFSRSESNDVMRQTLAGLYERERALSINDARAIFLGPFEVGGRHFLILKTYSFTLDANVLVAIDLQDFLDAELPWWFAQDNEVKLYNPVGNRLLARTAKAGAGLGVYTHTMNLEVGSLTLLLDINSRRAAPKVFSNTMATTVALLAFLLIASLALLWRDFRRRLAVEERLRDETAFRESMQDSMAVGMRVWDLDGRVRYVNPAFCNMVGYREDELTGTRPPMPYWPPDDTEEYTRLMSRIFAGKMPRDGFEATFIHRSGRTIYAWVVEAPLRDAKGEQTGWMSSILDITDRKQADALIRSQEEKLQTTARLALIGEMASNVAHELNQPLATMVSFAESGLNLSQKPSAQVSDLQPLLTRIRDQALRAAKVIKSVQALVRERQPKREAIVMQEVLNSLLPTLDAMAKQDHVVLHTELQPADLTLVADKIMLEQALINLVKNAIESFTERFTHRLVQVQVTVHEALCDIAVSDNGPGMSDEDMTRLLQPFFSTKAQGLGLGVNLCRSVCEAHGGRLIVQRGAQGGMCFLMQIPIGEAHVA